MRVNVYLDDVRQIPQGFVGARTAEECVAIVREYEVGILSLDFELGFEQPNGLAAVNGIIVSGRFPQEVFVHSSSLSGRAMMVKALREAAPPDGVIIHDGPMSAEVLTAVAKAGENDA